MLDNVKTYLVEVLAKNVAPKVAAAVVSYLFAYLMTHENTLEGFGITSGVWPLVWQVGQVPSGHVTLIEWDTLTAWGGSALVGLLVAGVSLLWHHGQATVKGTPQSGDVRTDPPVAIVGGQRATDPTEVTK